METRSMTVSVGASSLRVHVGHIVEVRSEEEMVRVATWRVVAAVQNMEPVGDRPMGELVRPSM